MEVVLVGAIFQYTDKAAIILLNGAMNIYDGAIIPVIRAINRGERAIIQFKRAISR